MTGVEDWTGRVGDSWASEWRRTDRSLTDLSRHLDTAILAAAPDGAFRALDLGCGAGATTLALTAARPDATVTAIDLSPALATIARDRIGAGARVMVGDVLAVAPAHAPYDLLWSRHGVMFFDDPTAAFATLHRTAAPDARLVFSCFRDWHLNGFAHELAEAVGAAVPQAGPGPFAFADQAMVATMLETAGWREPSAAAVDFTYCAGTGSDPVDDALSFFQSIGPAASALRAVDAARRPALVDRMRVVVERHRSGDAVDFPAAAWIWSATA